MKRVYQFETYYLTTDEVLTEGFIRCFEIEDEIADEIKEGAALETTEESQLVILVDEEIIIIEEV